MSDLTSITEQLSSPIGTFPGVSRDEAALLRRLGIRRQHDLLFHLPRDYTPPRELKRIDALRSGEACAVCGTVVDLSSRQLSGGRSMFGVLIRQELQHLRGVWFNQNYLAGRFRMGQRVVLAGKPQQRGGRWEITHPQVEFLEEDAEPREGEIQPIYPLTEGISQRQLRRWIRAAVARFAEHLEEAFPAEFLARYDLPGITAALQQIHAPETPAALEAARGRLIFQELMVLQLALAIRRYDLTLGRRAPALEATAKIDSRITRLFPFPLTADQRQAIDEVAGDMGRDYPMNRLIQGDVGSGKTVVAIYAMLLAVAHGHQAALMAPTEVLARQHFRTLSRNLAQSKVRLELLTGSLTPAQRRARLERVSRGEVDVIVGTHAIANAVASSEVDFARLALVVIDEQHKFGVRQRAMLRAGGVDPHYLVLTATPIPRTVSMTLFGDLDVSLLKQRPPGRQPVHTYWADDSKRERWWEFFRKKLREGRQGYVISPLVEESEQTLASAETLFEELANGPLEAFRIELVHGRMGAAAKDAVMQAFERGEVQVLVATSVVEVGVDVPNATLMTIEGGERFGLAQLHQLRGRITRGQHAGYLCVFAQVSTPEAGQRLRAFEATSDGFELAELDFQLRGPGDLFGIRQHGLPPLRIADLQRDQALVERAREAARQVIAADPQLTDPAWSRMKALVVGRYGPALEISDVG